MADEDEPQQVAHGQAGDLEGLVGLAQVEIRPSAARKRRAEMRVHQAVGEGEDGARDPRVEDVRSAHRRDHEWDHQERPDPDHADDVGGGGGQKAHAAPQVHGLDALSHALSASGGADRAGGQASRGGLRRDARPWPCPHQRIQARASMASSREPLKAAATVARS